MRLWRGVCLGVAFGLVGLLFTQDDANAHHFRFLVNNPQWNRACTYVEGCGVNPDLRGINAEWEINGRSNLVCSDYGPNFNDIPVEIREVLPLWDDVLLRQQFDAGCPGGRSATWFRRTNDGVECTGGAWACTDHLLSPNVDPSRRAYYPGSTDIWLVNGYTYGYENGVYTGNGLRYLASHELGHVFGLNEAYLNDHNSNPLDDACNGNVSSVTDLGVRVGNDIRGPCAGDPMLPNASDRADTNLLHQLNPMTQLLPSNHSPGVMSLRWWDPTWADTGYRFYAYRLSGNQWLYTGQTWLHTDKVGHAGVNNTTYYIKGSQQPASWYRLCGYTYSGVHLEEHWVCGSSVYLS